MEASNGDKQIFCYCHFGGDLVENEDNRSMHYKGGRTIGLTITSMTTFDDLIVQIKRNLGLASSHLKLKYALEFDKAQLIDLLSEEDMHRMMNFSDKFSHVYVFCTEEASGNLNNQEAQHSSQYGVNRTSVVWVLGRSIGHQSSDGPMDRSNLVARCVDAAQHVVTSDLWKREIYGSGQTFSNAVTFRNALYRYSIAHKFNYTFLKNCPRIIRACCSVEGCPWCVNANRVGQTDFLRVETFVEEHSHSAQDVLSAKPKARSKLAAGIISTKLKLQPETTPNQIKAAFASELNIDINYQQSWLVREKAMQMIHGMPEESYRLVPWLCNRIMEADEHTVTGYETSLDHQFSKVFVAYGCSIRGFLLGCRPIIYIDGCHLSGPYRGTLLSATSSDADNNMFPIAYAIISTESYDDWHWFLTKLKEATKSVDLTIISDRHKNIVASVANVFGKENHGYCYRHIKENFSAEVSRLLPRSKLTKENALKLLDSIMYARLDIDFQTSLANMRSFKAELAEWVLKNEPEQWVMSKFPRRRWDNVTTNVAESFNAWVLKERHHYVFALMNEHRDKLASKLLAEKEDMKSWRKALDRILNANYLRMLLEEKS